MEETLISQILAVIDIVYILVCNAATYFIITFFESANGTKILKTWHKRLLSAVVAGFLGYVFVTAFQHNLEGIVVGFFIQFIVYDYLLKPIIQKLQKSLGSSDSGDIDLTGKDKD